jgi:hypothetical protein
VSIIIASNAEESVRNVEDGNKELQEAKRYQGGSGRIFATVFIVYTIFLWTWDWLNT